MRTVLRAMLPVERRLLRCVFVLVFCSPWAAAQKSHPDQFPKFEVFGGYLDSSEFPYNVFNFGRGITFESDFGTHRGLDVSVIRNFNRYLGIKADFSAQFRNDQFPVNVCVQTPCSPVVQTAEFNPKIFNFLAGPEIKKRNHTRFTPFAYALFGVAHTTATFKTSGSALNLSVQTYETGFSLAAGAGLDIRIARRFSFRTAADFNPRWVGRNDEGSRQIQNGVRVSVGILFH